VDGKINKPLGSSVSVCVESTQLLIADENQANF
jgi:hypothetical protein